MKQQRAIDLCVSQEDGSTKRVVVVIEGDGPEQLKKAAQLASVRLNLSDDLIKKFGLEGEGAADRLDDLRKAIIGDSILKPKKRVDFLANMELDLSDILPND